MDGCGWKDDEGEHAALDPCWTDGPLVHSLFRLTRSTGREEEFALRLRLPSNCGETEGGSVEAKATEAAAPNRKSAFHSRPREKERASSKC